MRFGNCCECREYKYLPKGTFCPTCLNKTEFSSTGSADCTANWRLIYCIPGISPIEWKRNLTEDIAKSQASGLTYVYAQQMSE